MAGSNLGAPEFTIEVFQNEYLPSGARELDAIVTVTSAGASEDATMPAQVAAAEVIIIDCSGSMGMPMEKIIKAREAAGAAIEAMRDGVAFAVIAGTGVAKSVYPAQSLAIADPQTKAAARHA